MARLNEDRKIEVKSIPLSNLLTSVATGTYRIPQFQRDFVWNEKRVMALLDSIYREFPIGSFFLWDAGDGNNHLFRQVVDLDIPPVDENDKVYFILDGQQRITSLYVTLNGLKFDNRDYGRICFDVKKETFTNRNPDSKRYIAVCDIWGGNILRIAQDIDDEFRPALERCWECFRTYPISIVEVRDKELPDVCEIFQRINQSGKRLDRFDLISAMTFSPDFDLRQRFNEDVLKPLDEMDFGEIDPSVLTQLLALKVHGQCTERYEYMLTAEDISTTWESVVDATLLAAWVLRNDLGVIDASYLPYNALFTLMAYYFAASNNRSIDPSHVEWLHRWFWRASFGQHYSSAAPTRMGRTRKLFDSLLEGDHPEFDPGVALSLDDLIDTRMTWYASAIRNGFLCLLAQRNPLHLRNGTPLDLVGGEITGFTKAEKHHIFPRSFLETNGPPDSDIHSLPNFCFLTAELNKWIRDRAPSDYIERLKQDNPRFDDAARSHLIPFGPESGVQNDDYDRFLRTRGTLILEEIARLCGGITTPRREERQMAVEKMEKRWRDFIDAILADEFGADYWDDAIPQHVRQEAENRINDDLRKHPDRHEPSTPRQKLDYLNVMDYAAVIENRSNWPHFDDYLGNKAELQSRMRSFNDYRNCVMHGRPMTELVKSDGETAILWFETVLPDDVNGD